MAADRLTPQVQEQLLEQLKDLQMPAEIALWPPAPGWWIVGVLTLAVLVWLVRWFRSRPAPDRYRQEAMNSLTENYEGWKRHGNAVLYADDAGKLVRQVAIHLHGRERTAQLTGAPWSCALNELGGDTLSTAAINILTNARYQPDPEIDVNSLHGDIMSWLKGLREVRDVQL